VFPASKQRWNDTNDAGMSGINTKVEKNQDLHLQQEHSHSNQLNVISFLQGAFNKKYSNKNGNNCEEKNCLNEFSVLLSIPGVS
jgi:hypothetical protein